MNTCGLILWNSIAICEMSQTSWPTGKHRMKGDSENQLKARLFLLVQRLNIILFLRKSSQGSTNLVRKFYLANPLDTHCVREEFGQECWSADIEEKLDALEILEDSMQKKY